jgi:hypothetical protein
MGKTTAESPIDVDIDIDGWVNDARNWISYERYFFFLILIPYENNTLMIYLLFFIEEGVDK